MPQDKDLKRLVRSRMQETGERYTQAKAALYDRQQPSKTSSLHLQWVEWLGDKATLHEAFRLLKTLPEGELLPLAVAGARNADWRVRRGCCRLLDDLTVTAESLTALEQCLQDSEPRVRRAAVHTLSCQHCKPEGCVVDQRSIFERMVTDRSRKVREIVVGTLTWSTREPWAIDLLRRAAAEDPSEQLREIARRALDREELRQDTNRARLSLPSELVAKTERHRGKWVAISEGRIIAAGGAAHAMQRTALRQGHTDVRAYWVEDGETRSQSEDARP